MNKLLPPPSPLGMMTYAFEYIDSAMVVDEASEKGNLADRISRVPAYFLISHGLELTYKSYLLSKGVPYKTIYDDIRHDLLKCYEVSKDNSIEQIFLHNKEDLSALNLLSELNRDHQFRYIQTGPKVFPYWSIVEPYAVRLHQAVAREIGTRSFAKFYPLASSS